jgi:hypothetical protein
LTAQHAERVADLVRDHRRHLTHASEPLGSAVG